MISKFVSALSLQHIAPSLTETGTTKLLASMDVPSTVERISSDWPHIFRMDQEELCGVLVVKPPLHLYHLFVRSERQQTGIGRSLLAIADRRSVEQTGSPIATVNSSLNAIEAYRRFGFLLDGPEQDHDGVRFQPMRRSCRLKGWRISSRQTAITFYESLRRDLNLVFRGEDSGAKSHSPECLFVGDTHCC